MRGGYLHNTVLLGPIERLLEGAGAQVRTEYPVRGADIKGSIDLVTRVDGVLIAIEAERTPDRVIRDIRKARAIDAGLLLIVVPTRRVADAVLRRLRRERLLDSRTPRIFVLPLGPALAWLTRSFPFSSPLNAGTESKSPS